MLSILYICVVASVNSTPRNVNAYLIVISLSLTGVSFLYSLFHFQFVGLSYLLE